MNINYFFSGNQYIRVRRNVTGSGSTDPGYPRSIADVWNWPDGFGANGIDAAFNSGIDTDGKQIDYFFSGSKYIRVRRNVTGPGTIDPGYPRDIASVWNWPAGFGADGIDAALNSGIDNDGKQVDNFFSGKKYIRVRRGVTGPGVTDPGYPKDIASAWHWPAGFGANGIDAAFTSGIDGRGNHVAYFFSGSRYIRVRRGVTGSGHTDPGYPIGISSGWGWPNGFGASGISAALNSSYP
jgi:hypothetical protein